MSNLRERFTQFMQGRYGGNDTLNKWLFGLFLVLLLLSIFIGGTFGGICNLLAVATLAYAYFRIFSRNISKRQQENQKLLQTWDTVKNRFSQKNNDTAHRIYRCPQCSQKVRVPKGKGKIEITCPSCRHKFIKRT